MQYENIFFDLLKILIGAIIGLVVRNTNHLIEGKNEVKCISLLLKR